MNICGFYFEFYMLDNHPVFSCWRFTLGPDQHNVANAVFCSWMAVGNILGFSAGASGNWHK